MGNYLYKATQHVFLSYVRENKDIVDLLYGDLTVGGIAVWLDRNEIKPGSRWKDSIRAAITDGAYFLACFSKEAAEKNRSHMKEAIKLTCARYSGSVSGVKCAEKYWRRAVLQE